MGLKICAAENDLPPLITSNAEVAINANPLFINTNLINRVWKIVMDKVTDMMEYMMMESISSNKCDDCTVLKG